MILLGALLTLSALAFMAATLLLAMRGRAGRFVEFVDQHPEYTALFVAVTLVFVDILCRTLVGGSR